MTTESKADQAVAHILRQMQLDGRLAYLLGPGSRSYELLTEAYAERHNENVAGFRASYAFELNPVRVKAEGY